MIYSTHFITKNDRVFKVAQILVFCVNFLWKYSWMIHRVWISETPLVNMKFREWISMDHTKKLHFISYKTHLMCIPAQILSSFIFSPQFIQNIRREVLRKKRICSSLLCYYFLTMKLKILIISFTDLNTNFLI